MMYRGETSKGPVCARHASAPAQGACWSCQDPLCEPCIVYERLVGHGTAIVQSWGTPTDGRVGIGQVRGRFAIDRAAAYVIVTRAFAERAHAPVRGERIEVVVDGALTPAELVTLPELAVDGARAAEVEAAVVEALPERLDGIVGSASSRASRPTSTPPAATRTTTTTPRSCT